MTVAEDSTQYKKKKKKKHSFLVAVILFFNKNYYNLMASLSHLEALLFDVTLYLLKNCSFLNKASEIYCWLTRVHTKEKPLQSDPFDWPEVFFFFFFFFQFGHLGNHGIAVQRPAVVVNNLVPGLVCHVDKYRRPVVVMKAKCKIATTLSALVRWKCLILQNNKIFMYHWCFWKKYFCGFFRFALFSFDGFV